MAVQVVYFVRHGETRMNLEFRYQGRVDTPLNERGREQMAETAQELDNVAIDRLYCSPLNRALESATILSGRHGMSPVILDWLTEVNHGEMEGLNREESDGRMPGLWKKWVETPDAVKFPGGDSLADVAARVAPGLAEVCRLDSGTVVFVTHQVITSVAKCILQGLPLSQIWINKLVNGRYLRLELTSEMLERAASSALRVTEKEAV